MCKVGIIKQIAEKIAWVDKLKGGSMARSDWHICRSIGYLFVSAMCALICGCAAPTRIATNKGLLSGRRQTYVHPCPCGGWFLQRIRHAFKSKMISIAKDCGTVVEISEISPLELDKNVHMNRMKLAL
jgi:hypothetical protein